MQCKLKKISGDASFREFYKIQKNSKFTILVKANKDKFKNLIVYAAVNKLLVKNKIKAPKLIQEYFDKGMMEVENLGDHTFYDYIKNKKNKLPNYKKLIEIIIKLQNIKLKNYIKIKNYNIPIRKYNLRQLHNESDLFFAWYLKYNCKKNKFITLKSKIKKELNNLYKKLYFQDRCFVHKDFHASNIMIKSNKFGLIDSQDAIKGNLLYDVASVIDDVRIKLSFKLKSLLFNYYLTKTKKIKVNEEKFAEYDFDTLSIQRNLRILGTFVRLFKRDNKANYLKFLPYTWKLVELRLQNPIFNNLKYLLNEAVPAKKRNKVNFNAN